MGDPVLANIFWLVNAPEEKRFFGIGTAVYIPVGHYRKGEMINVGENRWKGVIQAGLVQGVTDDLTLDLTIDATLYGDNDEAGTGSQKLSQKRSHQTQPWLRYALTPESTISVGYSKTFGGVQRLDGTVNGLQTNAQQVRLEFQSMVTPSVLLTGQVARDLAVTGGFTEDLRATLRAAKVF